MAISPSPAPASRARPFRVGRRAPGSEAASAAAVRRSEMAALRRERDDYARRLLALESTLGYFLLTRVWRAILAVFPPGSARRRLLYFPLQELSRRLLLGSRPATPLVMTAREDGARTRSVAGLLADFAAATEPAARVAVVFSATQLVESEGQRPTQLALAMARRGIPVVFAYWRWTQEEWCVQDRLGDRILQVPIDEVVRVPELLFGRWRGAAERLALFEFPWPGFLGALAVANAHGWTTVYDVLDDWEEFHRAGQAIWYDADFERHLVHGSDAVVAVNLALAARLQPWCSGTVAVVGNGLRRDIAVVREPRPLERGEVTVGYFGHLAGAWFDWQLVEEVARCQPRWLLYLIGYGGEPPASLPPNVRLLGKQPQALLAAFAANWDVAIVPFKAERLAAGADPIKTYEYLAMGLPVVATGAPPPPGAEHLVRSVAGPRAFVSAIGEQARAAGHAARARRAFAAGCSWERRLDELWRVLRDDRGRVAEKRYLFSATS